MNQPTFTAFDNLVEKHSREIFGYLWRLLPTPEDAEDALQETFLRAFRAYPKLRDHTQLRAWLFKIATNVAYTHLKRQKRHSAEAIDQISQIAGPEKVQQDLLISIRAAIQQLPAKQGAAILLRSAQGLSYAEIGAALNCSPDSARANHYQGIQKLRRQFAENEQ